MSGRRIVTKIYKWNKKQKDDIVRFDIKGYKSDRYELYKGTDRFYEKS